MKKGGFMAFYHYPQSTAVGRLIPKEQIYQHEKISSELKRDFIEQIESIRWMYKLAGNTINLASSEDFNEFIVVQIKLKTEILNPSCLKAIDQAIPRPIIFELMSASKISIMATHKKPSQNGNNMVIDGHYFQQDYEKDAQRKPLPPAVSLEALYQAIFTSLMPKSETSNFGDEALSIEVRLALEEKRRQLMKEITKLEKKVSSEKQFNRRVELSQALKNLKKDFDGLKA